MTAQEQQHQALRKELLTAYFTEHAYLSGILKDLDGKAQITTAISGGLLAVVVAFVNNSPKQLLSAWPAANLLFMVTVLLLAGAVFCAVITLQLRKVVRPPGGSVMNQLVNDLIALGEPEVVEDRMGDFYEEQLKLWRLSVDTASHINEDKAWFLRLSQRLLLAAILCLSAISLIRIEVL